MLKPKELLALATRDPQHLPERLLLNAQPRIAKSAAAWRRGSDENVVDLAWQQRRETIGVARGEGDLAGTPFFIALVPAYIAFLEQEARFFMRLAALHGDDPASKDTAIDMLVIRGVHADRESAAKAIEWVEEHPMAPPKGERRGFKEAIGAWYRAVMGVLVFAGFIEKPDPDAKRRKSVGEWISWGMRGLIAGVIYLGTFVFPVTFMMVMSWSCESDARRFTAAALSHYGLEPETKADRKQRRSEMSRRDKLSAIVHGLLLFISVSIPLALVSLSIIDKRWTLDLGIASWVSALAGLSLAIGLGAWAYRSGRPEPDPVAD